MSSISSSSSAAYSARTFSSTSSPAGTAPRRRGKRAGRKHKNARSDSRQDPERDFRAGQPAHQLVCPVPLPKARLSPVLPMQLIYVKGPSIDISTMNVVLKSLQYTNVHIQHPVLVVLAQVVPAFGVSQLSIFAVLRRPTFEVRNLKMIVVAAEGSARVTTTSACHVACPLSLHALDRGYCAALAVTTWYRPNSESGAGLTRALHVCSCKWLLPNQHQWRRLPVPQPRLEWYDNQPVLTAAATLASIGSEMWSKVIRPGDAISLLTILTRSTTCRPFHLNRCGCPNRVRRQPQVVTPSDDFEEWTPDDWGSEHDW